MEKYQIRVLQPALSRLADDLAGLVQVVSTDAFITTRRYPSRRYAGHDMVYIDLHSTGQKGATDR